MTTRKTSTNRSRDATSRKAKNANSPTVSSLPKLPIPYSSLSLSPDRQYAVASSKDTLHIIHIHSKGLKVIKTIPVAQHFVRSVVGDSRSSSRNNNNNNSSIFGPNNEPAEPSVSTTMANVVITDVAWNCGSNHHHHVEKEVITTEGSSLHSTVSSSTSTSIPPQGSLIAAAGSNGLIVVWNAENLVGGSSNNAPEAVLSQHVRAVNRLDWHPSQPGLLLSASQDSKVLLWERRKAAEGGGIHVDDKKQPNRFNRIFGMSSAAASTVTSRLFTWHCRATFEPKSDAVRDIKWSPHFEDVFALVTSSGTLIAYNIYLFHKAIVKLTAHAGEATTLDWHPKQRGIIATGGAGDRCVKVWNILEKLTMDKDDAYMSYNSNTMTSRADSVNTDSSMDNESSPAVTLSLGSQAGMMYAARMNPFAPLPTRSRGNAQQELHTLSIAASVTRVKWRPMSSNSVQNSESLDLHEPMLAVATSSIKGASAGGAGQVSLWSWSRPFMPVCILEGHTEGAVPDFDWIDTPAPESIRKDLFSGSEGGEMVGSKRDATNSREHPKGDFLHHDPSVQDVDQGLKVWQHILSIGRDGRCLVQSFVRGERPISRVPPSCFSMANLSPFQEGYGSLQIFSICQPVPSGQRDDFLLTGLRRDHITAKAPGIFREEPRPEDNTSTREALPETWAIGSHIPNSTPSLHFNVIDQGLLEEFEDESQTVERRGIRVAPEVVHFSRFADRYEYYLGEKYASRVEICMHNARVAHSLRFGQLAEMWKLVAIMLDNSGTDGLMAEGVNIGNVMEFVMLPTIRSILEERADAGDLQTCVTLSEVLSVVTPDEKVKIPNLDIELIREWYLAYIDILRDMCLFSQATHLIRNCDDPFIKALNKQSTTIHECCPTCGKMILTSDGADSTGDISSVRRQCKSCRRRIGFCFLCHEPVKGIYVWCPGCGHGGHLEHALEWFGGSNGYPVREVCPTGCGHRCNMLQQLNAFPRTDSLLRESAAPSDLMDLL